MSTVNSFIHLDRYQVAIDPICETISLRGMGKEKSNGYDFPTGSTSGVNIFSSKSADFIGEGITPGDILSIISDPSEVGSIIGHYTVNKVLSNKVLEVDRDIPCSLCEELTYKVSSKQPTQSQQQQVSDGVDMFTLLLFLKNEYVKKSLSIGNAPELNRFEFPLICVSKHAGEFIMGGVNGAGAGSWSFCEENGTSSTSTEGSTTELIRNGGWVEKDTHDREKRVFSNIKTYSIKTSPECSHVNITSKDSGKLLSMSKLSGELNQSVSVLGPDIGPDNRAGFSFTGDSISRGDGGDWREDGVSIGCYLKISLTKISTNSGIFGPVTAVSAGQVSIQGHEFTNSHRDEKSVFQIDSRKGVNLVATLNGEGIYVGSSKDSGAQKLGPMTTMVSMARIIEDRSNNGDA